MCDQLDYRLPLQKTRVAGLFFFLIQGNFKFGIDIPNCFMYYFWYRDTKRGHTMNKRIELNSHRRLFIIDIENAVGSGVLTSENVLFEKALLDEHYSICDQDLVVIGVSHSENVFPAHAWPSARIVMRRGHDGADIALKTVLKNERVEERFKEVVIVSGDGTFAEEAALLKGFGAIVTVHAEIKRLATRLLRFAAFANLTRGNKVAAQLKIAA